jgi:hypothetical protein
MSALLDRLYQWFWRVPDCTPGNCYCRRTCAYILDDTDRSTERAALTAAVRGERVQ